MSDALGGSGLPPPARRRVRSTDERAARLSEGDVTLLRLLDEHRVLTTRQVERVTGAPTRTVEYRLGRLHTDGLVGKVRPPVQRGSAPLHWWLTNAGARLVTGSACADGATPNPLFVQHAAAIAELWLALREHGPEAGLGLTGWWRESAGWQDWQPLDPGGWGPAGRSRRVAPDAVFHAALTPLADATGMAPVGVAMVEVDLGTMTVERIKHKLALYHAYAVDQAWTERHPHCPVLLIVTTAPARAANIARAAGRVLRDGHGRCRQQASRWSAFDDAQPTVEELMAGARRLLVAVCGEVRDPARAVRERCWLLPGDEAAEVNLADLLADRVRAQQQATQAAAVDAEQRAQARVEAAVRALAMPEPLTRYLDDPAATQTFRVLTHSGQRAIRAWVDEHGAAGGLLLDWYAPRASSSYAPIGDPPALVLAALAGDYPQVWHRQAERMLAAEHAIRLHAPQWHAAAGRLLDGRLLRPNRLEAALTAHVGRDEAQPDAWAPAHGTHDARDYPTRRADAVQQAWRQLGFLDRRRTKVSVLTDDREHLLACSDCGLAVPRDGNHQHCPACRGHLTCWPGPARHFADVHAALASRVVPPAWRPDWQAG